MWVCVWRPEVDRSWLLQLLSTCSLEAGSLSEPEVPYCGRVAPGSAVSETPQWTHKYTMQTPHTQGQGRGDDEWIITVLVIHRLSSHTHTYKCVPPHRMSIRSTTAHRDTDAHANNTHAYHQVCSIVALAWVLGFELLVLTILLQALSPQRSPGLPSILRIPGRCWALQHTAALLAPPPHCLRLREGDSRSIMHSPA